jgi:hypothetical protein
MVKVQRCWPTTLGLQEHLGSFIMDLVANLDGDHCRMCFMMELCHSCGWMCFMELCLGNDVYMCDIVHICIWPRFWCNRNNISIIITIDSRKCSISDGLSKLLVIWNQPVVMIVTISPHSTIVMERSSSSHSMLDRCWYCYQHRRIEQWPVVLVTALALDHNTDRRWYLCHLRWVVCRTDVVVPVITTGSCITPVVVHDQVPLDRDLTWWWSNCQHRRMVRWSSGDDQYLHWRATSGDQFDFHQRGPKLSVKGGLEPAVINCLKYWSPDGPCLRPPHSLPTSTSTSSTHYKRRCGSRWRSSPNISKLSSYTKAQGVALEVVVG